MPFSRREQLALLASLGNPAEFGPVVQRARGVSMAYKIKLLAALYQSGGDPAELVGMITSDYTANGRPAERPDPITELVQTNARILAGRAPAAPPEPAPRAAESEPAASSGRGRPWTTAGRLARVKATYEARGIHAVMAEEGISERQARRLLARAKRELE